MPLKKIKRRKWTRNEIILLIGLIISAVGLIFNFFEIRNVSKQIELKQDFDNIEAKYGNFKKLVAGEIIANISFEQIVNFPTECPEGTAITSIRQGHTICTEFKQ
ncbi:MAG TPA: hypothetical protein VJJ52_00675 [Candidatus Nanoarchaeia archaeon]|nr:hypothetical protein [Candidatus Nanoarchaeia archaeon]